MENTFSILVWLNKAKINSKNKAPIYCRITINGKRSEIALSVFIEPIKWDVSKGRAKGNKEEQRIINQLIDNFVIKARNAYETLLLKDEQITSEIIKNILTGKTKEKKQLNELVSDQIEEMKTLINVDFTKSTVEMYKATQNHLKKFIKYAYNKDDIRLIDIEYSFITKFEYYLKVNQKLCQNSVHRQIQRLHKMIKIALKHHWIDRDPFLGYTIKLVPVEREILTPDELKKIEDINLNSKILSTAKDIFIFSCYTGLAYIDIYNLTKDNIFIGIDGEKWIKIKRQKTGTAASIPLLPKAYEILKKYQNYKSEKVFPVTSNIVINIHLKKIAKLCGISRHITFHIARHTFATTVTLTNGVPIETISKMLGHKSIKTTQIYSKVVEQKVSQDMNALKLKLLNY